MQPQRKEPHGSGAFARRLVVIKNSAASGVINKHCSDSIEVGVEEKIIRHGFLPECIRVADTQGPSITLDSADDGAYTQTVTLGPRDVPQNEEGSEDVCRIAIQYLNAEGGNWDPATLKMCDQHGDVDASASDTEDKQKKLNIQVTRACPEPSFYRELRLHGEVQTTGENPEEIAQGLFLAIDRKAGKLSLAQRANLVLAIDVMNTPAVSLRATIKTFQNNYSGWAKSLGFQSILVVGPVVSLTHRLDA